MVEFISTWAEQIIVAVIIATIIEMIIPNGNNKKYIKSIIGVYILFTIVSPIINKVSGQDIKLDMDYEKYFNNTEVYQTMSNSLDNINNQNIEDVYIDNLKQDIESKVKEKGYIATNINIVVNLEDTSSYGNINKISMSIKKEEKAKEENTVNNISINAVDKITIGNTVVQEDTATVPDEEKEELKEYLSSVYNVNEKYININ